MTEPRIFESPDKGETVYARIPGESTRVLVHESDSVRAIHDRLKEDKMWGDIRRMAETDPTMKDLVDKVIMTYHLLKDKK